MNEKNKAEILRGLRVGLCFSSAAGLAGMSLKELQAVFKTDRDFLASCRKAEADCEADLVRRAGQGNKGAAWILARRFPRSSKAV